MSAPKASCQNCFFFHSGCTDPFFTPPRRSDSVTAGECRRSRPEIGRVYDTVDMRMWPTVWADDWCGEWRHNESGETLV
jgi:hypothetical protein